MRAVSAAVTFAASPTQDQIWIEDQLDPDACGYNEAVAVRIRAPLDAGRVSAAVDAVVAGHPILRTCLRLDGNRLSQSVVDAYRPEPHIEGGFARLPVDRRERDALAWASSLAEQPLRPDAAPPYRWALVRLADDDHLLLFVTHQVLLDGVSAHLMLDEVLARGTADATPELPHMNDRYPDSAAYHRELLASGSPRRGDRPGRRPARYGAGAALAAGRRSGRLRGTAPVRSSGDGAAVYDAGTPVRLAGPRDPLPRDADRIRRADACVLRAGAVLARHRRGPTPTRLRGNARQLHLDRADRVRVRTGHVLRRCGRRDRAGVPGRNGGTGPGAHVGCAQPAAG